MLVFWKNFCEKFNVLKSEISACKEFILMDFENGIFQVIILIPMCYWRKQKKTLITGLKEKNT